MAKKNWWLLLLKSVFTCESKPKAEKGKTKGWKWVFDRFKYKQLPASSEPKRSLSEAREEQRKHALNVAMATAAAAEAAVAAAQAAAEVVRLTNVSRPGGQQQERAIQNLAAIKIQSAFRTYLAKKALRALKGVVRIQAIARGRAVRRRVSIAVKRLPSIHQSQVVRAIRVPSTSDESHESCERKQSPRTNNEMRERSQLECKSQRNWTNSIISKEEIESIYLKKQEAMIRRERMKQYSFSHRERQYSQMLEELIPLQNSEKHTTCRRKQWKDEENVYSKVNFENMALNFHPNTRISDISGNLRIKPKNLAKQDFTEEVNSPICHPRRSFCHMRQTPGDDDYQLSGSPIFPTYMAATESAKAKMRSMSTPRQRVGYLDTCFEHASPCKNNRLYYSWSSYNGDHQSSLTSSAMAKANCSQSKSLSVEISRQA